MGRRPRYSFFKIFLNDSINALRLPPAFVKKTGGVLPGKYILQGVGRSRSVKLEKVGEDLYFQDGWGRFVKDTCMEFGDFVIFSLCGDSLFSIKVYGKSGCEKVVTSRRTRTTYQPTTLCKEKGKQVTGVEKSSQNINCNGNWKKELDVSGIRTGRCFSAKKKIVVDLECEQVVQADCPSKTEDQNGTSAWIHDNLQGFPPRSDSALECGPSYTENCRKRGRDSGYEHVEEEMDDSSVEILGSYPYYKALECPNIPVARRHSFSRIYMTRGQTPKSQKSEVIQAASPVRSAKALGYGPSYSKKRRRPNREEQYEDHEKKEREVKPLEILGTSTKCKAFGTSRNNSLIIPVAKRHPRSQAYMTKQQALTSGQKNGVKREAKTDEPGQPFASVTLSKSYVKKGYVNFPNKFVNSYIVSKRSMRGLDKLSKNVKLRVADGRMWKVKLNCYSNRACLACGWPDFVRENNLREGDVCFFELLKTGRIELNVSTIRPQRLFGTGRR